MFGRNPSFVAASALALNLALSSASMAQCPTIDFENLPPGTAVSTQYSGVTFTNALEVRPRIVDVSTLPFPGMTTSGTHVLAVGDPLGDIDCGFLRMQFTRPQQRVEFSLGVAVGCSASDTVEVRSFDVFGNPIFPFQNISVNGLRRNICNTAVRVVASPGRLVGYIEVHAHPPGGCDCRIEMIDDLVYDIDYTPPVCDLQHPTEGDPCSCSPFLFTGVSYDPDGTFDSDRLEYSTSLRGPWTFAGASDSAFPPPGGLLYVVDTSAFSDGNYYFRLTTRNRCGLESTSYTRVSVDNSPPSLLFSNLPDGRTVRGELCFFGSVLDACGLAYTVNFKPLIPPGPDFQPVEPGTPLYTGQVDRANFARWNTVPGPTNPVGVPDGVYQVRISASDPCLHNTTQFFTYTVDNTPPVAVLSSPADCTAQPGNTLNITGAVSDAHLARWSIDVLGGEYPDWHTLYDDATGAPRSGLLYAWDRTGLGDCLYVIRLTAIDKSTDGCDSGPNSTVRYAVFDGLHCRGDYNRDGFKDPDDLADFIAEYFSACP